MWPIVAYEMYTSTYGESAARILMIDLTIGLYILVFLPRLF